ncbi:MAG TPA: acyl transferase [Flavobacteriaceae bacterium]|nr:acyl transferase [Flavobacteriaceae bacterium]
MLKNRIFSIASEAEFNETAIAVFQFQYEHNNVYREFCDLLKIEKSKIQEIAQIPFLPIQFFKSHKVTASPEKPEQIFTSSGTTGISSKHFVTDLSLYEQSFRESFEQFYGKIEDFVVLALLPSYLERSGSSLIYMVDEFIEQSKHPESGFYLNNLSELAKTLKKLDSAACPSGRRRKKILLIGVSFALLELVEKFQFRLKNTIVMETGGMKGRRKELVREELHEILTNGFGIEKIHSEYGMTELLSQAYSQGNGIFKCPKHLKVLIRDPEDPLTLMPDGKNGGINVIDLANLNSCAFIATQDLGKKHKNGTFEVLGRFDNSDIRGCNLLVL